MIRSTAMLSRLVHAPRLCARLCGGLRQRCKRVATRATRTAPFATSTTTSTSDFPLEDTRTVGIIAHIDAGKTTATERMLYYSGMIERVGSSNDDVDDGTTSMDFMPQEQERGITIQSAATTFGWRTGDDDSDKLSRIHLIDTPGHMDFTMEVERALRVLDGAVVILDAVAGPQSQTKNVIRQARRNDLPFVAFVNKMDRAVSDPWRALRRLTTDVFDGAADGTATRQTVLPLQVWTYTEDPAAAPIVDVVRMETIAFDATDEGKTVTRQPFDATADTDVARQVHHLRQYILDTLADLDDEFLEVLLAHEGTPCDPGLATHIEAAIRRLTIAGMVVPAFVGSSLKNIGVQPLIDGVVKYLPNPRERPPPVVSVKAAIASTSTGKQKKRGTLAHEQTVTVLPNADDRLCALAFKVVHDPRRGPLTFVRVYSGTLDERSLLLNMSNGTRERATRLLQMYASETEEVTRLTAGNIGAIVGLKDTRTGDTLLNAGDPRTKTLPIVLPSISIPPPVFVCAIEPQSTADEKNLETALGHLLREDPSLQVRVDGETGQRLISGMGELHLEITHSKLVNDFKVKCCLGKMWISYRETLKPTLMSSQLVYRHDMTRDMMGKRQRAGLRVTVQPLAMGSDEDEANAMENEIIVNHERATTDDDASSSTLSDTEIVDAVRSGVRTALCSGPLAQFPMQNICVQVDDVRVDGTTSTMALYTCATEAVAHALKPRQRPVDSSTPSTSSIMDAAALSEASPCTLLEPIMDVAVTVPHHQCGLVLSDLKSARSAQILAMDADHATSEDGSHIDDGDPRMAAIRQRLLTTMDDLRGMTPAISTTDTTVSVTARESTHDGQHSEQTLHAHVPLSSLLGYSKALRALTKGHGKFTMELRGYGPMSRERVEAVLKEFRGY